MMITAGGLLNGHAHFIQWGVVQISLANLIVILLMAAVFALAVVLKFPHSDDGDDVVDAEGEVEHVER
ncbi:MAG: hypothetical protein ABI345_00770 [Jatrophihabitans sp.]